MNTWKMVYLGDLVAIMEERDFDRDAIDADSLESEVMELICSYLDDRKETYTVWCSNFETYNSVHQIYTLF